MGKQSHVVKDRKCLSCGQTFLYSSKYLRSHFLSCAAAKRAALSQQKLRKLVIKELDEPL